MPRGSEPAWIHEASSARELADYIINIAQSHELERFRWRILTAEDQVIARSRDGVCLPARRVDTPTNSGARGLCHGDVDALVQGAEFLAYPRSARDTAGLQITLSGIAWTLRRRDTQ